MVGEAIDGRKREESGEEAGMVPLLRDSEKLRDDPACRSGYEYAKRHDGIWRGENAEVLQVMERMFTELYRREGNGNSLGIALYLRELLEGRAGRGEK